MSKKKRKSSDEQMMNFDDTFGIHQEICDQYMKDTNDRSEIIDYIIDDLFKDDYGYDDYHDEESIIELMSDEANESPISGDKSHEAREALLDFLRIVFVDFYPLYNKIYNSEYKEQLERGVIEALEKRYLLNADNSDEGAPNWHPKKTLWWATTVLHWFLNSGKTLDFMSRRERDEVYEHELEFIRDSLDVKPFITTNEYEFEKLFDGVNRIMNDDDSHICYLIDTVVENRESYKSDKLLSKLIDSVTGRHKLNLAYTNNIDIIKYQSIAALNTELMRVVYALHIAYEHYNLKYSYKSGYFCNNYMIGFVLDGAARALSKQRTVYDIIQGYNLAKDYAPPCRRQVTLNMVLNAINESNFADSINLGM